MEQVLMVGGLAVSGLLGLPLILEWLRKFQTVTVLLLGGLILVYGAAPYSPVARSLVATLDKIPALFVEAAYSLGNGLTELSGTGLATFH